MDAAGSSSTSTVCGGATASSTVLKATKGPMESDIIIKRWAYPEGKSIPAVVIAMNHFVRKDWIYIPCEIGLAAFTLERGLSDAYSTLVDPKDIPVGYGISAMENADKFGFPPPDYLEIFQVYPKIVQEIEEFLNKHRADEQEIFIFCREDHITGIRLGMEWLYRKAGREFTHRIFRLEILLVVLTLGGLERLAEKSQWTFEKVVKAFQTCSSYSQTSSSRSSTIFPSTLSGKSGRDSLSVFSEACSMSMKSYTALDKRHDRKASQKMISHPYAALGGFMLISQAKVYLNQGDFLYMEPLACDFHREKILIKNQKRIPGVCGPRERLSHCALLRVRNELFLALDVLIANYEIKARKGWHFPNDEEKDKRK